MTDVPRANAEIDDPVNAFVAHTPPVIPGNADGPLAGLTFAVKDLYDIEGYVTGGGSPEWLATHQPATATAPTVQKCLDAGATMIGKTVCDELFYSFFGENAHYGTPINSAAPRRVPGGSSSGSAAAVAAGMCDFALGSDTGGSVRIPAAWCSLHGLRPTHGRIDLTHGMAMAPSFDSAGWFTRDAATFAKVAPVLLDDNSVTADIERLVVGEFGFSRAHATVSDNLRAFLEVARPALPDSEVIDEAPGGIDPYQASETFRILQGYETWQSYGAWVTANNPDLGPGIKQRIKMASELTAEQAEGVKPHRAEIMAAMDSVLTPGTIMAIPVSAALPPKLNTDPKLLNDFRADTMALICLASLASLPQISIPVAQSHGMPVGIGFVGWRGGDEALVDLAQTLAPYVGRIA